MAGLALLGWRWTTMPCTSVRIVGAAHAGADALQRLAQVDTGRVLFDLDPVLIEDRVRRHPWVREAEVTRMLTGTLTIRVAERTTIA